jgi:DNA-binding transcriptional MerR regulator
MGRLVLIEPHGDGAAPLQVLIVLHLREVFLVCHAWRHLWVLSDEGGKEQQNLCHTVMLNLGVDSRVKRQLPWGMRDLMTIGKAAALAGVSADTIRYYERLGLFPTPTRTRAGYRVYQPAIINRLNLVRNAQRFGFSLREIAGFLRVRDTGGAPCRTVRAAAERMLEAIDRQIADLAARRDEMRRTLRGWDRRLEETPAGTPGRLLENL